jgi:hypothetical protein
VTDTGAVIGAAAIGVGGSVIVAIAGFIASTRSARISAEASTENTRLMLEAERQYRLWDQRAKVYAETLAYANHRAMTREDMFKGYQLDEQSEAVLKGLRDSYDAPNWFDFEARVRAFASEPVYRAFIEAHGRDTDIARKAREWYQITELNRTRPFESQGGGKKALVAWEAIGEAIKLAATADGNLAQLIRDELQDRPVVATSIPSTAAPRRAWWRRSNS